MAKVLLTALGLFLTVAIVLFAVHVTVRIAQRSMQGRPADREARRLLSSAEAIMSNLGTQFDIETISAANQQRINAWLAAYRKGRKPDA